MSLPLQSDLRNNFLSRLADDDFAALAEHLEPCSLSMGNVLVESGHDLAHVIFPESGIASIVVVSPDEKSAEGGVVGREGFVAPFVLLGTERSPHRIEIQMAGQGHRMETARFVALAREREDLRGKALLFAHTLFVQTAFTAMSNAVHPIDERLARWILMCHDRSASDDLAVTHRYLSVMLCVRRASVTNALHALEQKGLVRAERGYVTVTSRARLEEFAADAYGPPEAEYARLLGRL